MSKKGGRARKAAGGGELSRFLDSHLQTIADTYQVRPNLPWSRASSDPTRKPRRAAHTLDAGSLFALQMMAEAVPGSLERTEWSDVIKLGDQVSRQATVGKCKIERFHVLSFSCFDELLRISLGVHRSIVLVYFCGIEKFTS